MKNRILVALLAFTINVVVGPVPHDFLKPLHPKAVIQYMELHRGQEVQLNEMITLLNLYWKYIKGGIIQDHQTSYINLLSEAFNIIFDEHYKDPRKFEAVKPFLIQSQNRMYPTEPIGNLDPASEPMFKVHVQSNPDIVCPAAVEGTKPHTYLKEIDTEILIEYMESHANMEEMLVLYNLYWKRVKTNECKGNFKKYCDLLSDAFNIVCDKHFGNVENFARAIPSNGTTRAERINSFLPYAY
ncbi:uncharacterized protein LOC126839583 isoform X1 [Adelges cooleyi]|uniref:uncharacterized protein LOC126839583 isoform X1 n=2 Tax=Adelges cooleyi TaxID=133065 RepID=UPI00218098B3|nr:uncharacterized protein LOC126839583 isoform X1 [Adelges cooleyi]